MNQTQSIRPRRKVHHHRVIHPIYAHPPYGIFSRIAREEGVSPSFVRNVALRLRKSKRIAAVLIAEGDRITGSLLKAEQKRGRAA